MITGIIYRGFEAIIVQQSDFERGDHAGRVDQTKQGPVYVTVRPVVNPLGGGLLLVVVAGGIYTLFTSYLDNLVYAAEFAFITSLIGIGSWWVARRYLVPQLRTLAVAAATLAGIGGAYYFLKTPTAALSERIENASLEQHIRDANEGDRREPARAPLREKLDAYFAKPFSPLFPGRAKGDLCAAYPSFDCKETGAREPAQFDFGDKDASQQADVTLDRGQARLWLTVSKKVSGHMTERIIFIDLGAGFESGGFPADLRKVGIGYLMQNGVRDDMIKECMKADIADVVTTKRFKTYPLSDAKRLSCHRAGNFYNYAIHTDGPKL
jgi:hypothetical protein